MITLHGVTIIKHNPNWPQILDHSYRLLIVLGSVSGKIIILFNLKIISQIFYLYAKDLYEAKY